MSENGATVLWPETGWRPAAPGRRCRSGAGLGHRACGAPAALELNRSLQRGLRRFDAWWAYCEPHAYGRVLLSDGIYLADEPGFEVVAELFGVVAEGAR